MTEKKLKTRVWMHKETGQLGYAFKNDFFGWLWLFDDHSDNEVLSGRFCNFLDDKNDPDSLSKSDFQDLGEL